MDFSLNEIQLMLADSVDKFLENDYDFERRMKYAESDAGFSPEVWQTFAELGWTAVPFSEDDGGFGGGPVDVMVLMERFGRGLVVEPYLANVILAGGVLRRAANAEQKEQWLAGITEPCMRTAFPLREGGPCVSRSSIQKKGWSRSRPIGAGCARAFPTPGSIIRMSGIVTPGRAAGGTAMPSCVSSSVVAERTSR